MDNFKLGQRVRVTGTSITGKIAIIDNTDTKYKYFMICDDQYISIVRMCEVVHKLTNAYREIGELSLLSHIDPTVETGLWEEEQKLEPVELEETTVELKIGDQVWDANTGDEYTYLKAMGLTGSTHLVLTKDDQLLHIVDKDLLRSKPTVGITREELKQLGYHIIN